MSKESFADKTPIREAENDTGFIVICFKPGIVNERSSDLISAARATNFEQLIAVLLRLNLNAPPLMTTISADRILRDEEVARASAFPPLRSLTQYWRMDTRFSGHSLKEIEAAFAGLPGIEFLYREETTSTPGGTHPSDDLLSTSQDYLNAAPTGIGVRWVWKNYPEVDGTGLHLIDVEKGWLPDHPDLPPIPVIFNDNHRGSDPAIGNHGSAVVGIIAGLDNQKGIIGILPKLGSVRGSSVVSAGDPHRIHIAEALYAAGTATPAPHVVLIELHRGAAMLPVETDPAVFDAIRLIVSRGIVVVEAGGNGGADLDGWTSPQRQRSLNRDDRADFADSGAILVGASKSDLPHDRWISPQYVSNYGSRLDCYAWGENIVTAGFFPQRHNPVGDHYTKKFGATSGASAIIAGAALMLHGINATKPGRPPLSPTEIRRLLSDPTLGTAQGRAVPGHIGVMPDLHRIIQSHWG